MSARTDFACCADWHPQTEIINGYICFVSLRSGRDTLPEQGGKQFIFCPWCGCHRVDFEVTMGQKVSEAKSKELV